MTAASVLCCSYCHYYGTVAPNPSAEHLQSHPVTGEAIRCEVTA